MRSFQANAALSPDGRIYDLTPSGALLAKRDADCEIRLVETRMADYAEKPLRLLVAVIPTRPGFIDFTPVFNPARPMRRFRQRRARWNQQRH